MVLNTIDGIELLGEVIAFHSGSGEKYYPDVLDAIESSGLDPNIAKEKSPRDAFSRAIKHLSERRIIRVLRETKDVADFQFTSERVEGDEYKYDLEAIVTLNKTTGCVACPLNLDLADAAQKLVDWHRQHRTTNDVTHMVQKVFHKRGDLFPLRDQGGVYFVPVQHIALVDQIETFLSRLGGRVNRFPVPQGTRRGDKSVKEAVQEGMARMVQEHEDAVSGFGIETQDFVLERQVEKIRVTRAKLEAYSCYLESKRDELTAKLEDMDAVLRERIEVMAGKGEEMAGPEQKVEEGMDATQDAEAPAA